jgi:hypothetical protein
MAFTGGDSVLPVRPRPCWSCLGESEAEHAVGPLRGHAAGAGTREALAPGGAGSARSDRPHGTGGGRPGPKKRLRGGQPHPWAWPQVTTPLPGHAPPPRTAEAPAFATLSSEPQGWGEDERTLSSPFFKASNDTTSPDASGIVSLGHLLSIEHTVHPLTSLSHLPFFFCGTGV